MSGLREKLGGSRAGLAGRIRPAKPATLIVALIGLVALAFVVSAGLLWRSDNHHGDKVDAGREAVAAAREGVPRLYTYRYDSVDEQLADVMEILTDPFRDEFSNLARVQLAPVAKQLKVVAQAKTVADSVVSADTDEVTAILFVNQQTALASTEAPISTGYTVRVTLQKHDDHWLISRLAIL